MLNSGRTSEVCVKSIAKLVQSLFCPQGGGCSFCVRWNYVQSHCHRCSVLGAKGSMTGREAAGLNKDLERGGKQKAKER